MTLALPIIRTLDPAPFIAIADHPEVRPWLGIADATADMAEIIAPIVANPDNFALLTRERDGGYLLAKLQPGLYAAHTMALPPARGRPMLRLMRDGFAFMFAATDCVEIVTQVPDGNEHASRWSELAGFRDTFRRESFFPLMGERVGCQFRSLTYQDWAVHYAPCKTLGAQFHEVLKSAGLADHADDAAHDAMVGATILAAENHNLGKAVALYNRWASAANYMPARIVSALPPVVDTGEALVGISNGALEVLNIRHVRSTPLDA